MLGQRVTRGATILALILVILAAGGSLVRAAPPIDIFRLADGTDASRLAKVDTSGNVSVAVSNLPAAETPFQIHVIGAPANTTGTTQTATFTVPANKRLAIDYISVFVSSQAPTGVEVIVSTLATGIGDTYFRIDMRKQEPYATGDAYVGEHRISAYAQAGTTVTVTISRSNATDEMLSTVDVVGRLQNP